ncbi:RteC domain-containing protein [Salegentibacter sp. HM20]
MSKFSEEIESLIHAEKTEMRKADQGIRLCIKTLWALHKEVNNKGFEDVAEEIEFFKHVKPVPMSYLIYFTEVKTCELSIPKVGNSHKIKFLQKEIKKLNKFFTANNSFVNYMEQCHNYLDQQFFLRQNRTDFTFILSVNYYQYPEFSTSHDMLWAKTQAYYRYIHFVREKLEKLQPGSHSNYRERQPNLLVWSGSKTDLVELIYALHSSSYINHGTPDIHTISSAFEDFFNVKLENVYKTYSEIKARKASRTRLLDNLKVKFEARMAKDDQ